MRRCITLTSFVLGLAAPAAALAAGGPVPPVQGHGGIGLAGSDIRLIAAPAGRNTVVQRVTTSPWRVQSRLRVSGRYGIPGADFNGTTTGLSADSHTLILERLRPSGRPRTTRLLVLDVPTLRVRKTIVLPGWATVDAVSPHGRWMYLIRYASWPATSKYEVLAYDLAHGKLIAEPIVDPHDRGEAMTGFPVSRVMSPGGRWAYTLYGRPSGEPFVHALDTVRARAVCIDLPSVNSSSIGDAHLKLIHGAGRLQIIAGGSVQATIDTHGFAVGPRVRSAAVPASRAASHEERTTGGGGDWPWEIVTAAIVALGLAGAAARRLARPRAT
jgi:hypothetical protein